MSLRTVLVKDLLWFDFGWVEFFCLFGFWVWSKERAWSGCLWWQEKSVPFCDTNSRNTFYPCIRFSVLALCLDPWAGFCWRCIISVSQIQSFWQSPHSSNSSMAFLQMLILLNWQNDFRKDQSARGQEWVSMELKEGLALGLPCLETWRQNC